LMGSSALGFHPRRGRVYPLIGRKATKGDRRGEKTVVSRGGRAAEIRPGRRRPSGGGKCGFPSSGEGKTKRSSRPGGPRKKRKEC